MPKTREAALKALALDESLGEAHVSLATIAKKYDYGWETAEKEFRRAIQLNPEYATAQQGYAEYLSWQGRFDEALAGSDCARQLDSMSLIIANDCGPSFIMPASTSARLSSARQCSRMDRGASDNFGNARNFIFLSEIEQGQMPASH
jgi:tetratricopeptide (TPR) repeat protein